MAEQVEQATTRDGMAMSDRDNGSGPPSPPTSVPHGSLETYDRRAELRQQRRVRINRALELKLAGATDTQIGEALGIARTTVNKYIEIGMRQNVSLADREAARKMEVMRLDRLLLAWHKSATAANPDPRAADIYLRIAERRARLMGLDAPAKIDLSAIVADLARSQGWDVEEAIADAAFLAKGMQGKD